MSTPEISIDEQAEAFKALKRGEWRKVQAYNWDQKRWDAYGKVDLEIDELAFGCVIRLKPAPKLRPWTMNEVPWGARFRSKTQNTAYSQAVAVCDIYVTLSHYGNVSYPSLLAVYEFAMNGTFNWQPCGVLES